MTALGIVDILDPRAARPSGTASYTRTATPGAAAFADVIQDASRAQRADHVPVDPASGGATEDEASAEDPMTALPSTAPLLGAIVVPPESESAPATVDIVAELTPAPATPQTPAAGSDVAADGNDAPGAAVALVGVAVPSAVTGSTGSTDLSSTAPAVTGTPAPVNVVEAASESTGAAVASPARVPAQAVGTGAATPIAATATADADSATGNASSATGMRTGTDGPVPATGATPPTHVSASGADRAARTEGKATTPAPTPDAAASDATPAAVSPAPATPATATSPSAPSTGEAVAPTPALAAPPSALPLAPTTPAAAAAVARPVLLPQLAAPVVSLAQAADGDHSLTLTVSPENLGPVTVRAHISGGAIHIELHAPNDLGREALRAILADLRRDLAAAAPHASLMLSTSDDGPGSSNPQGSPNGGGASNGNAASASGGQSRGDVPADREAPDARPIPMPRPPLPDGAGSLPLISPHGGIDVFA